MSFERNERNENGVKLRRLLVQVVEAKADQHFEQG